MKVSRNELGGLAALVVLGAAELYSEGSSLLVAIGGPLIVAGLVLVGVAIWAHRENRG